ncbi:Acyl-CoA thioesterase [Amycolatopsis arida]|uniref:Acyl-CoA thioesterase n=1 Tax=Amycolatopsis arida TaxID=587909 RepID=A0A1I5ZHJ1_9PSEU|nr:thioesterase family protein [Amycolatopsis arida]TDX89687.1 acyl-CoA thioesterase [Amycolatopsis arida]SFQ55942.1 Acyl-CoA thioesterase [Amycolatopsis arida]
MDAVDAFYVPLGAGRFRATEHTAGPWTPDAQHFGPPSALLARALEEVPAGREMVLGRVTVEILGPAPVAELAVRVELARPGRSVELLVAELVAGDRPVARATAWRFAASDTSEAAAGDAAPLPPPEGCPPASWPPGWHGGYLDAVEWRTVAGGTDRSGDTTVWARQRVALVDGEKPSGLQRLLTIADSASGVSARLDPGRWLLINAELTVHVHRAPVGEWIGMAAATVIGPSGVGTAHSTLHDTGGPVGAGRQALLVRTR